MEHEKPSPPQSWASQTRKDPSISMEDPDPQLKDSTPDAEAHRSQFNRIEDLQAWRRAFIFVALFFGILLSLMDTSIMATAVYTIALDFDSLAKGFWAILSYQLAYLGFAVVFARASDFVGREFAVLAAYLLFTGFSIACGRAANIDQLIAFRTLQGIGGAGLYSLSIILLVELSTPKMMAIISSMIGGTIAISGVLGPILGGVLTQYASWRWIFLINGPVGGFAVVCFMVGWPHKTTAYKTSKRKLKEFDFIGAILILAASVLVVFGLQEAGTGEYAWNSGLVLGTLISGCICWVLLFAWEYYVYLHYRHTIASMFPFAIVKNRVLFAAIISTMLTGFVYLLVVVSLPLRFQIVNLRSPAGAGVQMLPLLCFVGVGSFIAGLASRSKNLIFEIFLVASCFILLGIGLMSTLGDSISIEAKCYGFQLILGLGVGATFAGISVLTAVSTDQDTHSVAQGIAAQIRIFGGSIGVAASNAIFNATCASQLQGILTPQQIRSLQTNTGILKVLPESAREAVRVAYADSFEKSLRVCVYVSAVALVVTLFLWQKNRPPVRHVDSPKGGIKSNEDSPEV